MCVSTNVVSNMLSHSEVSFYKCNDDIKGYLGKRHTYLKNAQWNVG